MASAYLILGSANADKIISRTFAVSPMVALRPRERNLPIFRELTFSTFTLRDLCVLGVKLPPRAVSRPVIRVFRGLILCGLILR